MFNMSRENNIIRGACPDCVRDGNKPTIISGNLRPTGAFLGELSAVGTLAVKGAKHHVRMSGLDGRSHDEFILNGGRSKLIVNSGTPYLGIIRPIKKR